MIAQLQALLELDVPQQFLHITAIGVMRDLCAELRLPLPVAFAGNAVIGDLTTARFVLCAHVDEASFNVTRTNAQGVWLEPCHRYVATGGESSVTLLGIRDGSSKVIARQPLVSSDGRLRVEANSDVRLGDRAVYDTRVEVEGNSISGKAVDDRTGALVALHAAALLRRSGFPVAVVLTDGEQNVPDGYFSRTFPHVLGQLRPDCSLIFVDGIFQPDLEQVGFSASPRCCLVVPHSGHGRGYSVPPRLFANLRDVVVPGAQLNGIDVRVSDAYHSRGDDWGMVTNPTGAHEYEAFFVSFGGWGATPARRWLNVESAMQCVAFLNHTVPKLAGNGSDQ